MAVLALSVNGNVCHNIGTFHRLHLRLPAAYVGQCLTATPTLNPAILRVTAKPRTMQHTPSQNNPTHTCVCLLLVVGECHAVELPHTVVSLEDDRGVLPGDGAACLDLRPADLAVATVAQPALCYKVEDAAAALCVTSIPACTRSARTDGSTKQ